MMQQFLPPPGLMNYPQNLQQMDYSMMGHGDAQVKVDLMALN